MHTIHPGDTVTSGNFSWINCKNLKKEKSQAELILFIQLTLPMSSYKKQCHIIKWNKTKQIQDWGWTYWVPLIGGTKLGVLGPRTMSAFSHTGLFIGFLRCFSLSTSKDKPTESKDLKSNLMPAGETQRFNRVFLQHADGTSEISSTFLRSQHHVQPLVQSVVTVYVRRVGHDGDGLLLSCSFTM